MGDSNKSRIILITHYTELYGANRSLLNLVEGLSSERINNILVLTPFKGKLNDELNKKKISNFVVPFKNETHYTNLPVNYFKEFAKFFYNWFIVLRYSKKLNATANTIIHTNASVTFIGAYFSYWLNLSHVWHIREFGKEDYNIKYNFGYRYFNYWANKSSAVIAISKAIYNKRVAVCKAKTKEIIYNGVIISNQLDLNITQQKQKQYSNTFTFGIIGVISAEKGQEDALEAFYILQEKYDNIKLVIAGSGDVRFLNHLKSKVRKYGLEKKVSFPGFINDTKTFYTDIDCLLMCSKFEGLGRVTIESMSYGTPVIGYNNAGTSEIIQDNYNGFLYNTGSQELFNVMKYVIENPTLLEQIIENAFLTVKEKFTIEKYAESVANIYQSLS